MNWRLRGIGIALVSYAVARSGGVYAVAIKPRIPKNVTPAHPITRPVSRWRIVLLLLCGMALLSGCAKGTNPPSFDRNGRTPKDVVVLFLEAVKRQDYQTATNLWYGEYRPMMEGMRLPSFQQYCDRFGRIKTYTLKGPYHAQGDREYRTVVFEGWTESGEHDGNLFALKVRDGEWKMNRSMSW